MGKKNGITLFLIFETLYENSFIAAAVKFNEADEK